MGNGVSDYLIRAKEHLNLSKVRLGKHKSIIINSGFTKKYFLLIDDFIMYDGRVGAALGLLGRLYAEENGFENMPKSIEFSFGSGQVSGRSNKNANRRNPSKGNYKLPEFTGNHTRHINDNIKASWMLKNIADNTTSRFADLPQDAVLNERITAIQSALFMIGYDVHRNK